MYRFKELIDKVKENKKGIKQIAGVIFVIFLLMEYNNSPVERFIKLSPEDRVDRLKALESIDSIVNRCKQINRRYTGQKPYKYWYEDIISYGEWYEPRSSLPVIKVIFAEEEDSFENTSFCEVNLIWFSYRFYNHVTFDLGEDHQGRERSQSFKNDMCDDESEEYFRRCK